MPQARTDRRRGRLWRSRSLAAQIATVLVCSMVGVLVLAVGAISYLEWSSYQKEIGDQLSREAEIVALNAAAAVDFHDALAAQNSLKTLRSAGHIVSAALTFIDGETLARYERPSADAQQPGSLIVRTYPVRAAAETAILVLTADRGQLYATLYARFQSLAIIAGCAALASVFIAIKLSALLVDPIRALGHVVRRVRDTRDYGSRCHVQGSSDIAAFCSVFNEMLHEIEQRDHELVEARDAMATSEAFARTSRHAGMAEVAIGILHNVGNVLTSANVATSLVEEAASELTFAGYRRGYDLLRAGNTVAQPQKLALYLEKLVERDQATLTNIHANLARLQESLHHIGAIIQRQQDLSRDGSNLIERVNLNEVIAVSLELLKESLDDRKIEILHGTGDACEFPTDRHKVIQILVNLIANARDAMRDTPNKTLDISLQRIDATHAEIRVRDSGYGMTKETQLRLFKAGFTTKRDGHGFGLHSSANAARELGGDVIAASDGPNLGAVFTLKLVSKPDARKVVDTPAACA